MRGIFGKITEAPERLRFNPAYAGNIAAFQSVEKECEVQPRVCGEYKVRHNDFNCELGSTPRMRGIFDAVSIRFNKFRFNPAYAGNILKRS